MLAVGFIYLLGTKCQPPPTPSVTLCKFQWYAKYAIEHKHKGTGFKLNFSYKTKEKKWRIKENDYHQHKFDRNKAEIEQKLPRKTQLTSKLHRKSKEMANYAEHMQIHCHDGVCELYEEVAVSFVFLFDMAVICLHSTPPCTRSFQSFELLLTH